MLAATIVATTIAGCGGSSTGKGSSQVTAVTTTGPSGPLTKLASIGYIQTDYLTGAGRNAIRRSRDAGDAVVNISLSDWVDEQLNTASAPAGSYVNLQVDAYGGPQVISTPVTFGASTTPGVPNTATDSRLFRNYIFAFNFITTDALPGLTIPPGNTFVDSDPNGNMGADEQAQGPIGTGATFTPVTYPAYVRAFPGRITSITVRLDSNTLGLNFQTFSDANGNNWGPTNPRGIFESAEFSTINFANEPTPVFNSVLSDYISFDLSHMPAGSGGAGTQWPSLTDTNGNLVTGRRVYFSGDNYALSDATNNGNFYQLTKDVSGTSTYFGGTFNTNSSINGYTLPSGVLTYLPGTYALSEINPSDPSFTSLILSQEGMFENWQTMIPTGQQVVAITLPSSQDNNVQDMVLFKENTSGQITDFYYGYMDFEAFEFFLYPINTLVPALSATSFHGTISPTSLYNVHGNVATGQTGIRSGLFKLDSPLTWQDGTHTTVQTGSFIVYRK